jgi:pimeloyl-ACP methyl ester carboxylesterase
LTGSCLSSVWLYYTMMGKGEGLIIDGTDVPVAFGGGKEDIVITNEKNFKRIYRNPVHFRFLAKGGHFAAFEVPELLAEDVISYMESDKVQESLRKGK